MGFLEGLYYNTIGVGSLLLLFASLEYISDPDTFHSRMKSYLESITFWGLDKIVSLKMLNDDIADYLIQRLSIAGKHKYLVYDKENDYKETSIHFLFQSSKFSKMSENQDTYDYDDTKYYILEKYLYDKKTICFITPNNNILLSSIEPAYPWIHMDFIVNDTTYDVQDCIKPFLVNGNVLDLEFFNYFTKHILELALNETYQVHILDNECNSHTFTIDEEHCLYIYDKMEFEYMKVNYEKDEVDCVDLEDEDEDVKEDIGEKDENENDDQGENEEPTTMELPTIEQTLKHRLNTMDDATEMEQRD